MKKKSLILIIVPILLMLNLQIYAQSNCVQNLRDARSMYDEGNFHRLPDMLKDCIKTGFSKDERAEAFKLLSLSYIFLNEPALAEENMLNLLKIEPEHQINEDLDPVEFINLHSKFDVDPVFLWGFTAGTIYNITQATAKLPIHNSAMHPGRYPVSFGIQAGLKSEIFINDKLSILPELSYANRSTSIVYDTLFVQNGELLATANTDYNTQWIRAAALMKYELPISNMLYVVGGPSLDWLVVSTRNMEGISPVPTENIIDQNIPFNVTAVLGVGKYFKLGSNYLSVDLRYEWGFRQMYANYEIDPNMAFQQLRNDNQYRLHGVSVNLAFLIPRFNPRLK